MKFARRDFFKAAGAAAMAAGAGLALPKENWAQGGSAVTAKDPRLFPGCCAYSYRKYLAKGQMTMESFILEGVKIGTVGVDMTGYWYQSTQPAYLAGLRHLAYKNGVPFSGAACGVSMVQPTAEKRAQAITQIKQWVDTTDRLGASHLRVFAGKLPPGATVQQGVDWVVEVMQAGSDYSAKKGIILGVEDHGGITQSADACLEIMRRVNSPYARINLDITHFIPTATQDAYAQIKACIPYASHTHIRAVFDDGTAIDMDRVWRMFAEGGYRGFMSVEYEGKEDPMTGVPALLDKVKALCRKYSTA